MKRWLFGLPVLLLAGCYTETYCRHGQRPLEPPVTRADVLKLREAGVTDDLLCEKVRQAGAEPLTTDAITDLKKQGVSERVIQTMIEHPARWPRAEEETTGVESSWLDHDGHPGCGCHSHVHAHCWWH
jgi:hypothetical protein